MPPPSRESGFVPCDNLVNEGISTEGNAAMPFYHSNERNRLPDPSRLVVAGELMKVGIVALKPGEEPEPHIHPNEEQFVLILEGRLQTMVGDETEVVGPGDPPPRDPKGGRLCRQSEIVCQQDNYRI